MIVGLFLTFIVVPLIELYLIFTVSQQLGLLNTIAILLVLSALGAVLVKREGVRAWTRLRATVAAGRLPSREVADAALVLVGGALLLTPGFLTDAVGLFLVLPVTRPIARRLLLALAARRALRRVGWRGGPPTGGGSGAGRVIDVDPLHPPEQR